ncbi:thyroid hormone-inducible hepatic protein [Anolis carolinensis]|nr:PREDICTED: thyroid hormone-inducible hepatic protein-like [Anolis carolinensis]|eukprot:XP_003226024.3 PREDICTED: thyroid hormone-inducible hepatic protein-like [Anolis carolinensis]
MESYFSAVQKMEQTVMFPSLLQGVSFEEKEDACDPDGAKDLYEYFTQLKSIKPMVEGGLVPSDNRRLLGVANRAKEPEDNEEQDLERVFYYHVSALHRILQQLTRRADAVTSKYNEIMSEISLRW